MCDSAESAAAAGAWAGGDGQLVLREVREGAQDSAQEERHLQDLTQAV